MVVLDQKHKALLAFIKKIIDVAAAYSKDDLVMFRSVASREYPSLVPLMDEYLKMAERADTDAPLRTKRKGMSSQTVSNSGTHHLFDLLREKKLFPSNSDLSEFASRVLPRMSRNRFDKMSRGDIAARIIEYLETRDQRTRLSLEASMRDAMINTPAKLSERKSFLSKWEQIIRGIEL